MAAQDEIKRVQRKSQANARRVIDFRTQGIEEVVSLGRYEYHAVQPGLSAHAHPGAVEICFLERGCQTYRVLGEEQRLVGGDLLVVPPGAMHDTGESPEDCGVLYWMILRVPEADECLLHLSASDSAAVAAKLLCLPQQKFVGRSSLKAMFRGLFDLHDAEETALKPLQIRHQLLCCVLEVFRCAESGKGRALSADIRQTVRKIQREPEREFLLEELAEWAALSLSRFKAKFKDEMGIAPREFILRTKMECAKRALEREGASVTEIAVELGFSSSQYFATVFKRFTQMTPGAYRRQYGAGPTSTADAA